MNQTGYTDTCLLATHACHLATCMRYFIEVVVTDNDPR